ncbi:Hypothetical protein R9X50_00505500 [Acrodontium crateriforme]|uniref:Uncharacterized protein n=1 Tax=Acrodontium crateriforme TaxID=150365 RepID=A0AAQ3M6F8_9PEZI|nr:Hypothetical protein R9X50_00505500 [Acrodontium crateriforme]
MLFKAVSIAAILADTASGAPVAESKQHSVYFTVDGGSFVSANAMRNGTEPDDAIILAGERLSVYPGTPAFLTGNSPNNALNFDLRQPLDKTIAPGTYGAFAPLVGDNYGYSTPVVLKEDQSEDEWSVYDGTLSHKLDSAEEAFFSCTLPVNGEDLAVLSWGVFQSNGQPPVGCETTQVVFTNN